MNKKIITAFVCLAITLITSVANAQDDPAVVVSLKKYQASPYDGVLFTIPAASKLAAERESLTDKIKLEVSRAVSVERASSERALSELEAKRTRNERVLQASLSEKAARERALQESLKSAEARAKTPIIWLGVGTVTGVLVTLGTVFVVNSVSK